MRKEWILSDEEYVDFCIFISQNKNLGKEM